MKEKNIKFATNGTPMLYYNNSRMWEENNQTILDLRGVILDKEYTFIYNEETKEWEETDE